jgi:hypothetical protein
MNRQAQIESAEALSARLPSPISPTTSHYCRLLLIAEMDSTYLYRYPSWRLNPGLVLKQSGFRGSAVGTARML